MAKRKSTSKRRPSTRSQPRSAGQRRASAKGKPSNRRKAASAAAPTDNRQRLQRVMAAAGVASRRECEIIIQEGRVEVDGQIVMELGVKVDPETQEIFVDAEKLVIEKPQYFILNKPPGVVSTSFDPSGRTRVIDLIQSRQRVYNVGRLDQSSEGLILVTNDGQLAHRLTHPRYGIEKVYHVQVDGRPTPADLKQLREGIYIAEGRVRASNIRYLKRSKNGCWLEIILDEGRNREIRRMLAAIGHKVRTLKRVAIGPLRLKDLPVGAHRPLTAGELNALKRATAGDAKPRKSRPRKTTAKRDTGESQSTPSKPRSGAGSRSGTQQRKGPKSRGASGKRTAKGGSRGSKPSKRRR